MTETSNWSKFRLLFWKNWILQWIHKYQLVLNLLSTVIFMLVLVLLRSKLKAKKTSGIFYPPVEINDLKLFFATIGKEEDENYDYDFLSNASDINRLIKSLIKTYGSNVESALIPFMNRRKIIPKLYILYTPINKFLENIVQNAVQSLGITGFQAYGNAKSLKNALITGNYFAGVQFDIDLANLTSYPKKLKFSLHFPNELRTKFDSTWETTKLFPSNIDPGPRNVDYADSGNPVGYLREGFLPLQNALTRAYLQLASGVDDLPKVVMQRYPYPDYINDPAVDIFRMIISLMLVLNFMHPRTSISESIAIEKEKQLKELMKIMGLSNWLHWATWFVRSLIILGTPTIFVVILLKIPLTDAVLINTSWSALLLFLFVYVVSSICFSFMITVFFSKGNTAAVACLMISFMTYLPYLFMIHDFNEISLGAKLCGSFLSNTALGIGFKIILDFEATGEGLQWSNMFTPVTIYNGVSIGGVIMIMLASCVICLIICLYFDQILPGDFGVPKKWNFPVTKSNPSPNDDIRYEGDTEGFEPEPMGKRKVVEVRSLRKKYGDETVVKSLSMNMYEDEITVLFGYNGAGKTTIISMLSGMIPPTTGTAIINGCDIRTDTAGARKSLGICSQRNILFDDISVANHIILFCRLKGLKMKAIEQEVDKYLKIMHLEDKANVASSKLSRGMKRKLSLCCALCGGTKVVLCDEPSSDLDPAARRQLWDLLQAEKIGRTMLVTSHFEDEADMLGDRIAFICDGKLKCFGTTQFLKNKFGSAYNLICMKSDGCNANKITAFLNRYIPDLKPASDFDTKVTYQLPDDYSSVFEDMFSSLEDNYSDLYINGYEVRVTSLENMFKKVCAEKTRSFQPSKRRASNLGDNGGAAMHFDHVSLVNDRLIRGNRLLFNQWSAMFLKKFAYTSHHKFLFILQNILPILFIITTSLIIDSEAHLNKLPPLPIELTEYPHAITVLETAPGLDADSLEAKIAAQYESLAKSNGPNYEFRSTGSKTFTEYITDIGKKNQIQVDAYYLAAATISKGEIIAWLNNQPYHMAPITVNMVYNAMAKALLGPSAEIQVINDPVFHITTAIQDKIFTLFFMSLLYPLNMCFCMCFVTSFYIFYIIRERESSFKSLQFAGGVGIWTFWLSQLMWDMITYSVTILLMIITITIVEQEDTSSLEELVRMFFLLLLFGFPAFSLTYLMSRFFTEPSSGYIRIAVINIFVGLITSTAITFTLIPVVGMTPIIELILWILRIFPHFSLCMSFNKMYLVELISLFSKESNPKSKYLLWRDPGILPELLYMLVTGVIFFLIVIVSEYRLANACISKYRHKMCKSSSPREDASIDDDVANEKKKIMAMTTKQINRTNLVLDRVTKYCGKFLAVNEISLCVKKNQCFGLLGVNGAGKTTTFKMMTGNEHPTCGLVYVKGLRPGSNMSDINKEIGYCPKYDAFLDELTGRETLRIILLMRGVPKNRIDILIDNVAKSFGLTKDLDKQVKAFNEGKKRLLSAAITAIGNPSIIYLNEPSSGMNPTARRQLWNSICRIRDPEKSIVLMSHNMEECEALCTQFAIMMNGKIIYIGSTDHSENIFGNGLILKIKTERNIKIDKQDSTILLMLSSDESSESVVIPEISEIKKFVEREIPNAILQQEYHGLLTFYIPMSDINLSKIFGVIERHRHELNIADYSIGRATLEKIFLDVIKRQKE